MSIKKFRQYQDADLYALIQNNKQVALEVIFERYYKSLCSFIVIYAKDKTVCEEIIADLFIKIWNNRASTEINNLKSYLFIAARNLALNQKNKKIVPIAFMETLDAYENTSSMDDNPFQIISNRESYDSLISVIDLLPERQREVLLMSRVENLDKNKIAEILTLSVRTVETTLYSAVKQLRATLTNRNPIL
ncbi:RNA polymerase sigma factor [Arcticibacter eurypsychrophilus]|uniref:RNA polymerase sigma factor n=1 Tax=Arcticibacter eurypsychrophilus TaxID=1434752 RepID=UPI00084DB09D|nr:sigma-70 family RNA polymerase sigma factor [Arcticibacter eurypsychrophilus]